MVVTVTGKGHAARRNGGPGGDIQVYIEEEPHKELLREDNNLIYNLLLDVPTAALGGDAEIPTIDGKVKIKIEPGTQPGKVVRLRSKGLPAAQGYGYGRRPYRKYQCVYSGSFEQRRKKTLEEMKKSDNFAPNPSIKEKIFRKFKSYFE